MIASSCADQISCVKSDGSSYGSSYGSSFGVKNDVAGIAREQFDYSDEYGSSGMLKSVMHYPHLNGITMGASLHEIMHTWASSLEVLNGYRGDPEIVCPGHWGWTTIGGQLGGWKPGSLEALSDGTCQAKGPNNTKQFDGLVNGNSGGGNNSFGYSDFELYMMGLIGADEVGQDIIIAEDFHWKGLEQGTFNSSALHTLTMEEIVSSAGARVPSSLESSKSVRVMYVVVSDEPLKLYEWGYIDQQLHEFQSQKSNDKSTYNFWEASQGKATITFDQVDTFLTTQPTLSSIKWPLSYNGVTPGSFFGLTFNNIGVFNAGDSTINTCLRIFTDGVSSLLNGINQFDVGLSVVSSTESTVQITKFREFNAGGALNESAETPDCSGKFETTTGVYTDTIQTDSSIFEMVFSLTDPTNLILKRDRYSESTRI